MLTEMNITTLKNQLFLSLYNYYKEKNISYKKQKQFSKLLEYFLFYINKHTDIFIFRFDVHFPQTICNNVPLPDILKALYSSADTRRKIFLKSIEIFIKEIKKHNKQADPYYIYATEKSKSEYEHYHVLLFLNGKITQNTHNYFELFQKIWHKQIKIEQNFNGGLIQRSKVKTSDHNYNGTRLKRNSENFISNLLYALNFSEYLLKDNQKEEVEFRKKINGSQLKYENQEDNPKIFAQKLIQFSQKHKEMDFAAYTFFDAKFNISLSQNSQEIIKIPNRKAIPSWVGDNSDNFKEDIFEELHLTDVESRCFSLHVKPSSDIQPSISQVYQPIQKSNDWDDDLDIEIPFPQFHPDKKLKEENIAKFSQPTEINQTPFYIGSYLKDPEEDEE